MSVSKKKLRKQQMTKLYLILNVGAFAAFILISNMSNTNNINHRAPSSKHLSKEQKLHLQKKFGHGHFHDRHTEKLASPLRVEIESHPDNGEKSVGMLKYIGYISSSQKLNQADIVWSIPKEVTLISGQKNQVIHQLHPGEVFKTEISVNIPESSNYRLHLKVGFSAGNSRYSSTAHHQTLWQEEVNISKKELLKRSNDYIKQKYKEKVFK